MARRPRNIIADFPFHVSLRGNNRQPVFLCDQDRLEYKSDLPVVVMGRPELTELYAAALMEAGVEASEMDGERAFLAGARKIVELIE